MCSLNDKIIVKIFFNRKRGKSENQKDRKSTVGKSEMMIHILLLQTFELLKVSFFLLSLLR